MYGMTDRELGLRDGWQLAAARNQKLQGRSDI
jgi:hypothetical protein